MSLSRRALALGCALGIASAGAIACSVEQTREPQAPTVDLDVEPGQWPNYNVSWADVDVGTREHTVTVPIVRVERETRQITVPYIDINPPGSSDREEHTISMELDVPNAGYELAIQEVRAAADDLWVIATLTRGSGAARAMTTRVSDHVVVNAPDDLDVRKVVVGERPDGVYNQQYRFLDSMEQLNEHIPDGARVLYRRGGTTTTE